MEQNFLNSERYSNLDVDSIKQQRHPVSSCQAITENDNGGFDCNICLDSALEPVVTFCGHLYCWPCIYKWIHVRNEGDQEQPNCPVCKASISARSMIPLYGRGRSSSGSEVKKTDLDVNVPLRPTPTGFNTLVGSDAFNHSQYYPGTITMNNVVHSDTIMFGEMVYARIFGGADARVFGYPGTTSRRRMRRQEKLETSLNRLSIFLFCCIIICLILF